MSLVSRVAALAARIGVEFRDQPTPVPAAFAAPSLDFGNLGGGITVFAGESVVRRIDFSRGGSRIHLGVIDA